MVLLLKFTNHHVFKYPVSTHCHHASHHHAHTCGNRLIIGRFMSLHASYTSKTAFLDDNSAFRKGLADDPSLKSSCMRLSVNSMAQPQTHDDIALFGDLLKSSGDSNALLDGMLTHDHIIRHVVTADNTYIDSLLVQMYVKCGRPDDALALLMNTCQCSAWTWNFLVRAFVAQGEQRKAFKLYEQMQLEKVMLSKSTIVRLLSICCSKVDLDKGRKLHKLIRLSEFKTDVFVGTALVSMYGKCGNLEDAWKSFNDIPHKDVVSYSVMIGVYARCGRGSDAIQLLNVMEKEGLKPDKVTFVCALDACNSPAFLDEGEKLHTLIKQSGDELDVVVATALINMYGKCGRVEAARKVFDRMPERNVVSWNNMLAVYVRHNQGKEAIRMLDEMRHNNVKPDRVTFVSVVDACAKHALLTEGERIHELILDNRLEGDAILGNALLNMYGKCGNLKRARVMFSNMHKKDVVSWNTMIALNAQHGQGNAALELLNQMQQEGLISDNVTFASVFDACASCSALVEGKKLHSCLLRRELELDAFVRSALLNMYGKCGNLKEARMMFDRMLERDVVTWNTMLALHVQHDVGSETFKLFARMQVEGVKPEKVTFTCILDACASSGSISEGKKLHLIVVETGYHLDAVLGTALVYMYGKCGNLSGAVRVFDRIYERDAVAWTAMIAMYAQHGHADDALNQFFIMQDKGMIPDDVTFVSVLTACSYCGFFDEALYCFAFMIMNYTASPATEHYVCMIDLFGRAGCLNEAEIILHSMPSDTSVARFLSLLGACRYHIDVERGERAAKHVLEVDVDGASSYITLSNIYAAACQISHEHKE